MQSRIHALACCGLTLFVCPAALAQHVDIGLGLKDNHIITGIIDTGAFTPGDRVFGADFGELFPNFTDEPGFDSLPDTFPVPSSISFTIQKALRLWEGDHFGDLIPSEQISIGFGPLSPVLTPTSDIATPGFALAVGANGEWHRHLEYTLQAPAADGIYLLELTLTGNHPTMQESLPFWLVFNQNSPEPEHDEAIQWVIDNFVSTPCYADCDASGTLDIDDFICYQTLFALGDPTADCDGDTFFTIDDFICFQTAFAIGC